MEHRHYLLEMASRGATTPFGVMALRSVVELALKDGLVEIDGWPKELPKGSSALSTIPLKAVRLTKNGDAALSDYRQKMVDAVEAASGR